MAAVGTESSPSGGGGGAPASKAEPASTSSATSRRGAGARPPLPLPPPPPWIVERFERPRLDETQIEPRESPATRREGIGRWSSGSAISSCSGASMSNSSSGFDQFDSAGESSVLASAPEEGEDCVGSHILLVCGMARCCTERLRAIDTVKYTLH